MEEPRKTLRRWEGNMERKLVKGIKVNSFLSILLEDAGDMQWMYESCTVVLLNEGAIDKHCSV